MRKEVFNWSEVHLYRSNFLQNPYFKRHQQTRNIFAKLQENENYKISLNFSKNCWWLLRDRSISNLRKHIFCLFLTHSQTHYFSVNTVLIISKNRNFLSQPHSPFGTFFNRITFDLQKISSSTSEREQEISSLSKSIITIQYYTMQLLINLNKKTSFIYTVCFIFL